MRLLIHVLIGLLVSGCLRTECHNETLSEAISTDSKYVATVFERNCGATTSFVRVVSIRDAATQFDGDDSDNYLLTMQGQPQITLEWINAGQLLIRRPGVTTDIFKQLESFKDVAVHYDP